MVNCNNIKENENTDAENEAMRNLKNFNTDQALIRALYAFIAKEIFLVEEESHLKK